jgi:hypothetical protein
MSAGLISMRVDQGPDRPAVAPGLVDRLDALDEELAEASPIGPAVLQELDVAEEVVVLVG